MADERAERATAWMAAGPALNGLGAFAFQVLGTRSLGAVGYAPIGVLWTLQFLWFAIAVTALEAYVTRLATVEGSTSADLARFLRLFVGLLIVLSIGAASVGVALSGLLFEGVRQLGIVLGLVVLGYGWYGVVRGRAAGAGRFRSYGLATIAESSIRLAAGFIVLTVVGTTVSLAWVLPLGALLVCVVAWLRQDAVEMRSCRAASADRAAMTPGTGRRFLAATSTANASVQFLLAGGPIVLLPLGAGPATVSVFFTTITTARIPMSFALNGGLSRVLPPLTRLALAGDTAGLRRASGWVVGVILGVTLLAAGGAAIVGPISLELIYGADFRPDRTFVVVVAASTVLAVGGLLLGQIYIAMAREALLPLVWLPAVVLAGVLVLLLPGTPTMRVAVSFAIAIAAAVTALSVPLLRGTPGLTRN